MSLAEAIVLRCKSMISRRENLWRKRKLHATRLATRRAAGVQDVPFEPHPLWELGPEFDPRHVLPHAERIARGISASMRDGTYAPRPPRLMIVPKDSGGTRRLSAFPIADEVVSQRLFRRLRDKNLASLGGHTYAYRKDLNAFDALRYVHMQWRDKQRQYVARYDLSNYFDSILHDELLGVLQRPDVHISPAELRIVKAFLTAPEPNAELSGGAPRSRGIPQGTSLSSFLANIVLVPVDQKLEHMPVGFVRYADDALIWGDTYDRVSSGATTYLEGIERMGGAVNHAKSPGIRLLTRKPTSDPEFPSVLSVPYLGHDLSLSEIRAREKSLNRIKRHLNQMLFETLLRDAISGSLDLARVSDGRDRDYLSFLMQARWYLLGPLNSRDVRRYLRMKRLPNMRLDGQIARFTAVTTSEDFRRLDHWFSWQTYLTLRKRAALLKPRLGGSHPTIWDLSADELWDAPSNTQFDLSLPRTQDMAILSKRLVDEHGSSGIRQAVSFYT